MHETIDLVTSPVYGTECTGLDDTHSMSAHMQVRGCNRALLDTSFAARNYRGYSHAISQIPNVRNYRGYSHAISHLPHPSVLVYRARAVVAATYEQRVVDTRL